MILHGDCLTHLREMPSASMDALVTDPPAGISFMGKSWDGDKGGRDQWVAWMTDVMRECLRVLKPGAHGLVWALPRTSHWTATALEDAGFEVRDVVTHLFGTGFPKSMNVSIALDKAAGAMGPRGKAFVTAGAGEREDIQGTSGWLSDPGHAPITDAARQWQGWGTALKPASEHWILVRKPCSEKTVAANVLKWGTGAINVDGCRIGTNAGWSYPNGRGGKGCFGRDSLEANLATPMAASQGRFPANLILSEDAAAALDEQSGTLRARGNIGASKGGGGMYGHGACDNAFGAGDSGGASRFFYVAKASKADKGADNTHPTVKSTALMRYLVRLVTPPGGQVLDPFAGSGSTGVAAKAEGMEFVGIEADEGYCEIAMRRVNG